MRGNAHGFAHGAGMMQHAPGIDHLEALGRNRIEIEDTQFPNLGCRLRRVPAQHRARRINRARIDVDGKNARSPEPGRRHRMQPRAAADVEEASSAQPIGSEETNEPAFRLGEPLVIDEVGVTRPVLPEREVAGQVAE